MIWDMPAATALTANSCPTLIILLLVGSAAVDVMQAGPEGVLAERPSNGSRGDG